MTYPWTPVDEYAPAQVDDEALTGGCEPGIREFPDLATGTPGLAPPVSASECNCVRHGVDPYCERHTTNTWRRP